MFNRKIKLFVDMNYQRSSQHMLHFLTVMLREDIHLQRLGHLSTENTDCFELNTFKLSFVIRFLFIVCIYVCVFTKDNLTILHSINHIQEFGYREGKSR